MGSEAIVDLEGPLKSPCLSPGGQEAGAAVGAGGGPPGVSFTEGSRSCCDPEEVHAGSLGVSQAEMEGSILEWDMLNLVAHVWFDGVAVPAPCLSILTVSWRPSQGPSLLLSQVAHIPPEDRLCLP